jgi:hypothetical protein
MRLELCAFIALALLAGLAKADTPQYGKVETFQPGKKYHCVPTADRKGWDCNEAGKAAAPPTSETAADVAPPPAATANASAPPPVASPPPAEPAAKSSELPSYLTNAAASGRATRPAAAAAAPPAAASPPSPRPAPSAESTNAAPATPAVPEPAATPAAQKPVAPAAHEPAPAAVAEPVANKPETPRPPAAEPTRPAPAPASPVSTASTQSNFLALPGDQFVIELAHADSEAELPATAVPRGQVYKLHLRQNGSERWLLLWGAFESVDAARAARDEIAAQGITPGWPRRIAPLQTEARRTSD